MTVHALPRPESAGPTPTLRATFGDPGEQSATDFASMFTDIQALIDVCALATMSERLVARQIPVDRHLGMAHGMTYNVVIARVSYASPLEVVFAFGTGGAVTVALFHRMVRLFDAVQDSRKKKAGTDTAVSAEKLRQLQIQAAIEAVQSSVSEARNPYLADTVGSATRALARLESVVVDDGEQAG